MPTAAPRLRLDVPFERGLRKRIMALSAHARVDDLDTGEYMRKPRQLRMLSDAIEQLSNLCA